MPIITLGDSTGDAWKIAFELSQTEGVEFKIIKIDHGVGVLRITKGYSSLINLTAESPLTR